MSDIRVETFNYGREVALRFAPTEAFNGHIQYGRKGRRARVKRLYLTAEDARELLDLLRLSEGQWVKHG